MVCRYLLWQTLTHIEISIRCHHLMKEQTSSVPHPQADATRSARASSQPRCRLKLWRDHFLQVEASATQFTRNQSLRDVKIHVWKWSWALTSRLGAVLGR